MADESTSQPLVTARELARTYTTPGEDAWAYVTEYQSVIRAAAENPSMGSQALATVTDTPRSKVRDWVDDEDPSRPDCVRAIDRATERGWLPVMFDVDADPWVVLLACVYSGGSINEMHVPRITALDYAHSAYETLGVPYRRDRSDDPGRAPEIVPAEDATLIGRLHVAMGAPIGSKSRESDISLPDWLEDAPDWIRRRFAVVYLTNRAGNQLRGAAKAVNFREERPRDYHRQLAEFLAAVLDARVVSDDGGNVTLSRDAVARYQTYARVDEAIESLV